MKLFVLFAFIAIIGGTINKDDKIVPYFSSNDDITQQSLLTKGSTDSNDDEIKTPAAQNTSSETDNLVRAIGNMDDHMDGIDRMFGIKNEGSEKPDISTTNSQPEIKYFNDTSIRKVILPSARGFQSEDVFDDEEKSALNERNFPDVFENNHVPSQKDHPGVIKIYNTCYGLAQHGGEDLPCVFPFVYHGTTHNRCTFTSDEHPWCATRTNPDTHELYHNSWGYCTSHCPVEHVVCSTIEGGPVQHAICRFPFRYKGDQYFTCTAVDDPLGKWCATQVDAHGDMVVGQWGRCDDSCKVKDDSIVDIPGKDGSLIQTGAFDDCKLPKKEGSCTLSLERYFYDPASGICQPFTYGGCGGNSNNFNTLEDCNDKCSFARDPVNSTITLPSKPDDQNTEDSTILKSGSFDDCMQPQKKGSCTLNIERYFFDISSGSCQPFTYGGCGGNANNFDTLEECNDKCSVTICSAPKDESKCSSISKDQWFFNDEAKKCELFSYGGCDENRNRFNSEINCQKACGCQDKDCIESSILPNLEEVDTCMLPMKQGRCNLNLQKYYFDKITGSCKPFTYGGCQGNSNNFDSFEDCTSKCSLDTCDFPKDEGPCNIMIDKWYYNKLSQKCEIFKFGGCGGNGNKFDSKADCEVRCNKEVKDDSITGKPSTDGSTIIQSGSFDDCMQPQKEGSCTLKLERYFFDLNSGTCQPFTYGGCGGNSNNFETLEDCNDKCSVEICSMPKNEGKCSSLTDQWFFNDDAKKCEPFAYGGCDGNRNRFSDQINCQKACGCQDEDCIQSSLLPNHEEMDTCMLPMKQGRCNLNLQKYYFDKITGSCKPFVYGGCQGNSNNFNSIEECTSRCSLDTCDLPKDEGPCNIISERWYYNKVAQKCEIFKFGGCGGNENKFDSKADCEGRCIKDKCALQKEEGPCGLELLRWHYDSQTRKCEQFVYSGCQGNLNNFESEKECAESCVKESRTFEQCMESKDSGSCNLEIRKFYFDIESGTCEPFVYGGCGGNSNNFDTLNECVSQCSNNVCSMPKEKGPCSLIKTQWFFNTDTRQCESFEYGGCAGNENRFNSRLACQKACGCQDEHCVEKSILPNEKSIDTCMLPKKTGRCNLDLLKYYFDKESGSCQPFSYGGCQGNSNNFDTPQECLERCSKDSCQLPKDEGPCNLHSTKWYYNYATEQCETFAYGGCGGNDNKFDSKQQCESRCLADKCTMPALKGLCGLELLRWHYNPLLGTCEPFFYSGCQGNLNNFVSREECEAGCKHESEIHFWNSLPDGQWLRYEDTQDLKELYPTFIPMAYHDPVRKIIKEAGQIKIAKDRV